MRIRKLERMCRRALYRELAPRWAGTRAALRRAIRRVVRVVVGGARQPLREKIAWMLRIVREARFAALVAGAILAAGLAGQADTAAAAPIELSEITAGSGGFAIDGEAGISYSGISVSTAGDVNGDGLTDVVVGAFRLDRSYVIFGKTSGALIELSDVTAGAGGFAMLGEASGDRAGLSVSGAGDVNGDGLADVIVGAFRADPNGYNSGRSYVVFGKTTVSPVQLTDVTAGSGGFAIDGEVGLDYAGRSVSGAGDVNGDGLADLIVGSYRADANGFRSGRSYIIFGKATGTRVQLSDVTGGSGGFVIDGEVMNDTSGWSVSTAGDVNGDGLADLIIGGYRASPNGFRSGRSYVVFGKPSTTPVQLSDIVLGTGGGFAIDGEATGNFSGWSVSGAGDVNGDGPADLIIGAWAASPNGGQTGRSYVVFGKASGERVQLSNVAAGAGGFAIDGAIEFGRSGKSVSGAGDINGDGLADLIIGGPPLRDVPTIPGHGYVVFGKANGAPVQLSDVAARIGGFAIDGERGSDQAGTSVSAAGDVNGDGLGDVIIGAPYASPNGSISGRSYVVFSPETPPTIPPAGVPAKATYLARSRAGDGAGGDPVVPTPVGDSRVTIDFSDADMADNGAGAASIERVTIERSKTGIRKIVPRADVADVFWWIRTDRVGFTDAKVTLKYLNSEIAGISGTEEDLVILTAPTKSGPWVQLASTVDPARNEISATVTGFSFFVIGNSGVGQQAWAEHWIEYR